jgi:hypothetical protein
VLHGFQHVFAIGTLVEMGLGFTTRIILPEFTVENRLNKFLMASAVHFSECLKLTGEVNLDFEVHSLMENMVNLLVGHFGCEFHFTETFCRTNLG